VYDKYELINSSASLKSNKKISFASNIGVFSQALDEALLNYETKNSEGLEPLYTNSNGNASALVAKYLVELENSNNNDNFNRNF
jgi:hypothetical protein